MTKPIETITLLFAEYQRPTGGKMPELQELPWIAEARKHIGLKETLGPKTNGVISGWLTKLKAWWSDDTTPWCGTFAATCVSSAGLPIPKDWYRAKAWLDLPVAINRPAYGCVVVFSREGGGHVGFVVGKDQHGNLMVLGGNQGDMVCIKPFPPGRVAGYRWPSSYPSAGRFVLPLLDSDGRVSESEA